VNFKLDELKPPLVVSTLTTTEQEEEQSRNAGTMTAISKELRH
jgi:hypothetical protein